MTISETLEKVSKLLDDQSRISLIQSKVLNSLLDICTKHKDRIDKLENDAREREADCKLAYARIKLLEKANGK
ncbi:hypothetical protein CCP1ISM_50039 [Azospirillaceae bacterium]